LARVVGVLLPEVGEARNPQRRRARETSDQRDQREKDEDGDGGP
jgi:hypothetical protein